MVYNRTKAQETNKSKLDQLLSELIEEETLRSGVLAGMVDSGVKTKEVQLMETEASFSKGLERAQLEAEEKYATEIEDLRSKIEGMTAPETVQAKPEANQPQTGLPSEAAKMLSVFEKKIAALEVGLTKTAEENKDLREREHRTQVNDSLRKVISAQGLEDPDTVLYLMRQQADFVVDPTDGELYVTKPDDRTTPLGGPLSATTAEEFVQDFASSQTGGRFKAAPKDVTEPSGFTGTNRGQLPPLAPVGAASQADYDRWDKELGIA